MGTIKSYNWSGARVVDDALPLLFPKFFFLHVGRGDLEGAEGGAS